MKKFAIATENGQLCSHFGQSEQFAIIEVENNQVIQENRLTPPEHKPGLFPRWLGKQGVTHVIAGGIGERAQKLFNRKNIEVSICAELKTPQELVNEWLNCTLVTAPKTCHHH